MSQSTGLNWVSVYTVIGLGSVSVLLLAVTPERYLLSLDDLCLLCMCIFRGFRCN